MTVDGTKGRAPRLTIGMPLFNDEQFVSEAVSSLLSQTYDDFQLIIADNCSTDRSVSVVRATAANDSRVRIIARPENIGLVNNVNSLAAMCSTEYFAWAASDDVWHPQFFEKLVAALDLSPNAALAFCTYTFTDEAGRPYGGPRDFDFGAESPSERIRKLAERFDDGCFYGVYRTLIAGPLVLPTWRGPNRITPYNTAYPLLFGVLASGGMAFVPGEPLWLNRIKQRPRHAVPAVGSRLFGRALYVFRQADLAIQSLGRISNASKTFATTVRSVPHLVKRFARNVR